MIVYNSLLKQIKKLQNRKIKKVEKSCWQTEKAVIWYQSCSGRETTEKQLKNLDNWTVKQPWKILKVLFFKELTFKNSKKGKNSQAVILTESNTLSESLILAQDERWRRA